MGKGVAHMQNCLFMVHYFSLEVITMEGFVTCLLQIMPQEQYMAYVNQNCTHTNVACILCSIRSTT